MSRSSPFSQALLCTLCQLCALVPAGCGPGDAFSAQWGDVEVGVDAKALRLSMQSHGRTLADLDLSQVAFGQGETFYEMQFGMFRLDEVQPPAFVYPDGMKLTEAPAEGPVEFTLSRGEQPFATGRLSWVADGHLQLAITPTEGGYNRASVALDCGASDHFAGLGAHTHDVDFRGQVVPVFVSEQGVGKRDDNQYPQPLWYIQGRRHTTHVAIPAMVSSRGSALALETHAYSEFDLCSTEEDRIRLESHEPVLNLHLFDGPTPLAAVDRLTRFTGRPRVPAPWAFAPWNDAIFSSANVREFAEFLRAEQIPTSAIWSEDWRGGADSGDLYRLHEDWRLDRDFYPDYEDMVRDLEALGIAHQVYFNTFLTQTGDVFAEADAGGYAIAAKTGGTFLFDGVDANFSPTGLVDLTNPAAVTWMKSFLEGALDLGARGWMADFAEWMPIEGVKLASGEDPALVHNLYPVLWAQLNDEVVRARGLENEVSIYHRSAGLFSQGYTQILWAGDQRTDFQTDDGLPTVIPMGLGAGAVGFPYYAHDIAGYQSSTNPTVTKELFFRWTELGALSPVMRTHHGTHARLNWNLRSDEESTAHFKRYAELHIRLYPYLRGLALRARDEGRPLWLAMGLLYPEDETAWPILDQFFLGDALLVAPVVTAGATSRRVYVPAGRFAPWRSEGPAIEGPATAEVAAPLGEIPVFLRAGGIVPLTDAPAQTLLPGKPGIPGLESVEGDRVVYVGLGAAGAFTEESGASYELAGTGTALTGLAREADGAVLFSGNGTLAGEDFSLSFRGHPENRTYRIFFR